MSELLVGVLESFLGEHRKHNQDTCQLSFDCPACSEEKGMPDGDGKGNLEINYQRNVFSCWACKDTNNMSGPVIKLLKRYGQKKHITDYLLLKPDASEILDKEKSDIVITLPEGYKKLSECSSSDYKADLALKYLRQRGITDDIIKDYDIGYTTSGQYYNRIIVPSYDINGKLNYFVARWFAKEKTKTKYLNPIAEKSDIVFNEGKINFDSTIYLVEGVTDHIVTPNSIPLLGKYLTPKLIDLLYEKSSSYIVIVLDDDAKNDAIELYKKLNFGCLVNRLRICFPPSGYDPSLIHEKLGKKGIVKLLMSARQLNYNEL